LVDFRNLQTIEGQMSQQMAFYNPTDLQDQSQHPPYIPPCMQIHHLYSICFISMLFIFSCINLCSKNWIFL